MVLWGFNPRTFCQVLTNKMKLKKIDGVCNSVNSFFWVTFSVCCHPEILLPRQRDEMTSPLYCQKNWQLTEKTWGRGWVVLVVRTKWRNISLDLPKNIARTAKIHLDRRELDRRHLLFGENLQKWINLYSPINRQLKMNLHCNIDGGKHVLACF